jgi:putative phage-type endonuclease
VNRRLFIGGSDIAGVMGLSRWQTPWQVWSEKTGKVEPEPDNEFTEMGRELEDTVARLFTKRTGKKVRRAPKRYVHPEYDYLACQVDRIVEGEDELVECKTCSAWKEKEWHDEEIPAEYILQVQFQLGLTGRSKGYLAVLIGGNKFIWKELAFDQELFDRMVEQAQKFWQLVKKNQEPLALADDNPFMAELHPHSGEELRPRQELEGLVRDRQFAKEAIEKAQWKVDEIEAKIKQRIGNDLGFETEKFRVTWKTQNATRIDIPALKEAGLYDRYAKTKPQRVLRVRALDEKTDS